MVGNTGKNIRRADNANIGRAVGNVSDGNTGGNDVRPADFWHGRDLARIDTILLDIAGPPTYTDSITALDALSLPEVLALYIKTRNYEREQRAREFEASLRFIQVLAAVNAGDKASTAVFELFQAWTQEVVHWRRPEGVKRRRTLTPQQKQFLHFTGAVIEDDD